MDARENEEEHAKQSSFVSDATLQIYIIPALVTVLVGVVLIPCFEQDLLSYSVATLYAVTVGVSFVLALFTPIVGTACHIVCAWMRRKIVALLTIKIPPFHLETSIVALFVAAIMLGANLRPQPVEVSDRRTIYFAERSFGFPVQAVLMTYPPQRADAAEGVLTGGKAIETSLLGIVANVLFAIGVVIAFAIWAERIIHKEDAARAEARATRAFAQATLRNGRESEPA